MILVIAREDGIMTLQCAKKRKIYNYKPQQAQTPILTKTKMKHAGFI